ncbi:hypothetical protein QCA50_011873 [Cerrena zonata]|uniref:Autophagy-related protein 101 n=1 Tax=Cerrena zonata TaxID=2478898 RepID=A0AAW0G0I0_9APHY
MERPRLGVQGLHAFLGTCTSDTAQSLLTATMSTHPVINVDLVLDRSTTKEVLRAVLHSILFHRLFGIVKPQTFEVQDVTMPGVDDPEIKQLIQDKVDVFWRAVDLRGDKRGEINVLFTEKRARKTWYYLSSQEEEVPWEQWKVKVVVQQPTSDRERQKFNSGLATTLTETLRTILKHTSSGEGRSCVPPIRDSKGISPFPVKITPIVGGVDLS